MEALNPVPVPAFELSYNGRAITQDIAPYVMSATYTDHLTGEADSLDIELEDTDGRWLDRWYPEKGASLRSLIERTRNSWHASKGEYDFSH